MFALIPDKPQKFKFPNSLNAMTDELARALYYSLVEN